MKKLLLNLAYWFISKYDTLEVNELSKNEHLEFLLKVQDQKLADFINSHKEEMRRVIGVVEKLETQQVEVKEQHIRNDEKFSAFRQRTKELIERMDKITWSMPNYTFSQTREETVDGNMKPNVEAHVGANYVL